MSRGDTVRLVQVRAGLAARLTGRAKDGAMGIKRIWAQITAMLPDGEALVALQPATSVAVAASGAGAPDPIAVPYAWVVVTSEHLWIVHTDRRFKVLGEVLVDAELGQIAVATSGRTVTCLDVRDSATAALLARINFGRRSAALDEVFRAATARGPDRSAPYPRHDYRPAVWETPGAAMYGAQPGQFGPPQPKPKNWFLRAAAAALGFVVGLAVVGHFWRGDESEADTCRHISTAANAMSNGATVTVVPGGTAPASHPRPPGGASATCTVTVEQDGISVEETAFVYKGEKAADSYRVTLEAAGFTESSDPQLRAAVATGVALVNKRGDLALLLTVDNYSSIILVDV